MILSQKNLDLIPKEKLTVPGENSFELPEKVLQFGTGVLLRGLPDFFIDKANRQGLFNGRVAVVKSTKGATTEFTDQDSLYTLCVRGLENGHLVSENIISSAISRVISADQDWDAILTIAASEDLKIIVSNTTEVGIQLVNESIHQNPPVSFPAKVLAVLYHRFKTFKGTKESGLVIIATELIPDNGKKLETIVIELAKFNELEADFMLWLQEENNFCNSLVDRIVPGKPDAAILANLEEELGYTDHLLAIAEPYRLWAIEGDEEIAKVLSFAKADAGVIIAEDIEVYRELKVRLLNGTHTLSSGIAFLSGIDTVKNAMTDEQIKTYIDILMATEIGPAIPYQVTKAQTTAFAASVKDRFANPSIEHLWINITFQYTMKMKIRILPLLLNYYKLFNSVPEQISFGFAAYLTFMQIDRKEGDRFYGNFKGIDYLITDDSAAYFDGKTDVADILNDVAFWGTDLSALDGFVAVVAEKYKAIAKDGMMEALAELTTSKINVL
ncbi:tagaturonate reductase [Pedobacter sp. Hv1]|uniref:tagaturonate reductase n=1 Tax=Pedobacter sp. Hv1 TaxID=1740090 RepID=UPI0006D8C26D|nr:tagaturonate reductase [Pedobacter sp. Hv1]KQC01251.1 altronate oxidoreductase [Pedobacter sp. Hv1]